MFEEPKSRAGFSQMDQAITEWWKDQNIFEKSVENRSGNESYVFYDGPPFMSGMPHYGHILTSMPKDALPRYQAMKGKYVERLWGWDCHGLPIENKVEDQLGLSGREEILESGLEDFIEKCYEWNRVGIENWRWYIDKIGRWANIDDAYRTMDQGYMESVWWNFKTLWDKGLVYRGKRVSLFSTDSSTPVSDFEVSMDPDNYQDTEDVAVAVKFTLTEESQSNLGLDHTSHLVAWTTTPWTIPANFALAVNPEKSYVAVELNQNEAMVVAEDLAVQVAMKAKLIESEDTELPIVSKFAGEELVGLNYQQVYEYLQANENDLRVLASTEVTTEDGTGVLHVAPAFGELDFTLGLENSLSFKASVDDMGDMTVGPWEGTYLRDANPLIADHLDQKGSLLYQEKYTHRLPYYRYDNPLIYKAQDNYFIDVQTVKQRLLDNNEEINWVPEHFKHGRFEHILETAPDWSISRSRFWGTAMPLWESEDGEQQVVIGSRDELMELVNGSEHQQFMQKVILSLDSSDDRTPGDVITSVQELIKEEQTVINVTSTQENLSALRKKLLGETKAESQVKPLAEDELRPFFLINQEPLDLHRPYIDNIVFTIDGQEYRRVEYTLDVWMDSGSMPFAQFNYPQQNKEKFEENFPGDFISEYPGQIRAWFYVLHVLANALFEKPAFKNVLVTGTLAGTDGRKMSKSYGNYPDPKETLEKYGSDAMRLYLMGSTLMSGNRMNFDEDELKLQVREFLIPLWNIFKYFVTYANMHEWSPKKEHAYNERQVWDDNHPWDHIPLDDVEYELDAWMLTKLQNSIGEITEHMETHNLQKATAAMKHLINEVSKWYIRRNRDRFTEGDAYALTVLYYTLVEICKLIAPITPFVSEEIYQTLVVDEFTSLPMSVHLTDYPVVDVNFFENYQKLLPEMETVRQICDLGQVIRTTKGIKLRQPLALLEVELSQQRDQAGDMVTPWMKEVIADELNVKEVREVPQISESSEIETNVNTKVGIKIGLDTQITPELAEEGLVRELVRQIQYFRKKQKLDIGDEIRLSYKTDPELTKVIEENKSEIKSGTSATELNKSASKLENELKVNDHSLQLQLK